LEILAWVRVPLAVAMTAAGAGGGIADATRWAMASESGNAMVRMGGALRLLAGF
jgi:hypothetical protein